MNTESWAESFGNGLAKVWENIGELFPALVGAFVILIIGYVISRILQKVSTAMLRRFRFDRASERIGVGELMSKAGIQATLSEIMGKIVFWLFMLLFIISAAETLGLEGVSETINTFVLFLPKVIGAVVILIVGLMVAGFVRDFIRSGAEGIGVDYAKAISNVAYGILVVVVATLAIGQLEIETDLLNRVIEIVLIAAAASLALALGLGTRDVAKDIICGVYAREQYEAGANITVGEDVGAVEEVGVVSTIIKTSNGDKVHIPNGIIAQSVVREGAATKRKRVKE